MISTQKADLGSCQTLCIQPLPFPLLQSTCCQGSRLAGARGKVSRIYLSLKGLAESKLGELCPRGGRSGGLPGWGLQRETLLFAFKRIGSSQGEGRPCRWKGAGNGVGFFFKSIG